MSNELLSGDDAEEYPEKFVQSVGREVRSERDAEQYGNEACQPQQYGANILEAHGESMGHSGSERPSDRRKAPSERVGRRRLTSSALEVIPSPV